MFSFPAIVLLLSLALGNLWKFSIISPDVRISFVDITVGLLFFWQIITSRKIIFSILKKIHLTRVIGVFSLVAALSLMVSGHQFGPEAVLVGSFYLFRWLVYSLFFIFFIFLPETKLDKIILAFSLIFIFTGIFQYLFFPDIRTLQIAEWDPHYFRVVGSLLDPGFIGILLVLIILFFTQNFQKFKPFSLLIWLLAYLALAFTYSRSSYLSFLAGMTAVSYYKKSWKFLVSMVILMILTLIMLPRAPDGEGVKLERTSSIQARIDNWKHTLLIIGKNPFMGVGFNTYRYAQRQYAVADDSKWLKSHAGAGADSSLLFVTATTGIFGLMAYLWYLRSLKKLSASHPELSTSLVALLIHSLFLNSLFYPVVMLWLALIVAREIRRQNVI